MGNKKLKVFTIILLISIIAIVFRQGDFKKKHMFKRNIIEKEFHFEKKHRITNNIKNASFINLNNDTINTVRYINDDKSILELMYPPYETKSYIDTLNAFSYNLNTSYNKKSYIKDFNIYTLSNNHTKRLNRNNFKAISIQNLQENKFLVLGEINYMGAFSTGFFIVSNNNIQPITILSKSKKTNILENTLIYNGRFNNSLDFITYEYSKISKIDFFKKNGEFVKSFNTKDNVVKPKIRTSNGILSYVRGETFNTNNALVKNGDNLYIVSSRIESGNLTLDKYSFKDEKYIESIHIINLPIDNFNVSYLIKNSDNLLVITTNLDVYSITNFFK